MGASDDVYKSKVLMKGTTDRECFGILNLTMYPIPYADVLNFQVLLQVTQMQAKQNPETRSFIINCQ